MMQSMMHLHMIAIAIAIASLMRWLSCHPQHPLRSGLSFGLSSGLSFGFSSGPNSWQQRWTKALSAFAVPPLFLLMTAVAIVSMGPSSCHEWEGYFSYSLSLGVMLLAIALWLHLIWQVLCAQKTIRQHALQTLHTPLGPVLGRILDIPFAFSAQVGFWSTELVVSKRLVHHLDAEHLAAVLAHENGHAHYRDTFWFFWLGGLRKLTCWLPGTDSLWKELLLLRELRADSWATQSVDHLVLAESLMCVVSMLRDVHVQSAPFSESTYAAFSAPAAPSPLAQRIDALLSEEAVGPDSMSSHQWATMAWALTPLLTIPFHR